MASARFPASRLWWAQVTVTPDASSTAVLRRGTWNGLRGSMPVGGQWLPSSTVGARLLWKKAQKNAKKNRTSEVINRIIPHRKPTPTGTVWCPWKVASRETSRHHWNIVINTIISPNRTREKLWKWNQTTRPTVVNKAPAAPVSGQGL